MPKPGAGSTQEHQRFRNRLRRSVVDDEPVEQFGVELGVADAVLRQHEAAEVDVGDHTEHSGVRESLVETLDRLVAVAAVCDDLGQHRVVIAPDYHALEHRGIDTDAAVFGRLTRHGRLFERHDRAAGRQESPRRILRIHSRLDRVPRQDDVGLGERELLTARNPDLLLDEVDSGDELGDRMLDLQPCVHLHEEELVGSLGGDDEFDGARSGVADTARRVAGGLADTCARRFVEKRRGCLLDDLLVSTLQRALALAEMNHVAVLVGKDLHLDVAWGVDEVLEEQRVVAERRSGLSSCTLQRRREFVGVLDAVHALATAAGAGLDQDRESDLGGCGDQILVGQPRP